MDPSAERRRSILPVLLTLLALTAAACSTPPKTTAPELAFDSRLNAYFTDCLGPVAKCAQLLVPTHTRLTFEDRGPGGGIGGPARVFLQPGPRRMAVSYSPGGKIAPAGSGTRNLEETLQAEWSYEIQGAIQDGTPVYQLQAFELDKAEYYRSMISTFRLKQEDTDLVLAGNAVELTRLTMTGEAEPGIPSPTPEGGFVVYPLEQGGDGGDLGLRGERSVLAMACDTGELVFRLLNLSRDNPDEQWRSLEFRSLTSDGRGMWLTDGDGIYRAPLNPSGASSLRKVFDLTGKLPAGGRLDQVRLPADGRMVYLGYTVGGPGGAVSRKLAMAATPGGGLTVLFDADSFDVSDDGGRIVYVQGGGLFVRDMAPPVLDRPLNLEKKLYGIRDPGWSPDGRYIVFSASESENSKETNLYALRAGDGALFALTAGGSVADHPVWGRDGFIYFLTGLRKGAPTRSAEIWRLRPVLDLDSGQ